MTPPLFRLDLQFRRNACRLISVELQLSELHQLACWVAPWSPLLQRWYLGSSTSKADALQYEAFDSNGPTTAALAVISEKTKDVADIRSIGLWNGEDNNDDAAGMTSLSNLLGRPDAISFRPPVELKITDWKKGAELVRSAATLWPALFATFGPFWYVEKKVFKDRPGVGWMIYLPKVLTTQQVPEARMLVPVMGNGKKQLGTIIVSVTDEPFSLENPAHVKIANDIEVRLVDQDLLPRYADL
jgi:hypothetical protein